MTTPEDWMRSFELRAQEHVDRAQELSRRLEQNSVTVTSPGEEVRLSVDSSGGLASLHFNPEAGGVPLDELAALVVQTSRQAQARLAESMSDVASQVFGRGSETASFISRAYADRFPQLDEDEAEGHRS